MKKPSLITNICGGSSLEFIFLFVIIVGLVMVMVSSVFEVSGLNIGTYSKVFTNEHNQEFCKALGHNDFKYEWLEENGFDNKGKPVCTVSE